MQKTLILTFLLFLNTLASAQSFYEIKWESYIDQMNYKALVTYDDGDISVRVNYIEEGYFCIAKYKCNARYEQVEGHKSLVLNTDAAALVYEESDGVAREVGDIFSYFAITKVTSSGFDQLLIYNLGYKTTDKGSFKKINPKAKFTEEYLKTFYLKSEPPFKKLHALYKEGSSPAYFESINVQDLAPKK